jgi:hypothetical protein
MKISAGAFAADQYPQNENNRKISPARFRIHGALPNIPARRGCGCHNLRHPLPIQKRGRALHSGDASS